MIKKSFKKQKIKEQKYYIITCKKGDFRLKTTSENEAYKAANNHMEENETHVINVIVEIKTEFKLLKK